jgi:PPK2 family polyphosphate:nucleotide phosphotransferase
VRLGRRLIEELRVEPGSPACLQARSTSSVESPWPGGEGRPGSDHANLRAVAEHDLAAFREELEAAQDLLYAADRWALLVVLQGVDAAGKDGTIKHVMSGVNPQGCQVVSFKEPSSAELRHDFLWRCSRALPERGRIGIFNRSHYEEVIVVRVHPELLDAERLPPGGASGEALWAERFEDVNGFERHLTRNGTRLVKCFLHVSESEQRARLLDRLDDPAKQWKFSSSDLGEHERYAAYQAAYEAAITATSTPWAPWYVIPADHKPALRALVGGVIVHEIERLHLEAPAVAAEDRALLDRARQALQAEAGGGNPSGAAARS